VTVICVTTAKKVVAVFEVMTCGIYVSLVLKRILASGNTYCRSPSVLASLC